MLITFGNGLSWLINLWDSSSAKSHDNEDH